MRAHMLDDGVFVTDAGNLFGDSGKASIKGAMHPVLVEAGDDIVLIDAGFGPELPEILEGRYELRREENLLDHLDEAGYTADDVAHVILSHLDADHVGWALNPRASRTPPSTCKKPRWKRLVRCRRKTDVGRPFPPWRRAWKKAGASCSMGIETFCRASGSRCGLATPPGIRSFGSGRAKTSRSTREISRRPGSGSTPTSYPAWIRTRRRHARTASRFSRRLRNAAPPLSSTTNQGTASSGSAARRVSSKPSR